MILNIIATAFLLIDLTGVNNTFVLSVKDNLKDLYKKEFNKTVSKNEVLTNLPAISLNPSKLKNENIALNAKSFYSVDLRTNTILESKKENEKLQIASLTKLMTAYIVLKEDDLNTSVAVLNLNTRNDDATMGLMFGDIITKENLLKGLLINSGSDAALALALSNSSDIQTFTKKMNDYAEKIGLNNTNFTNPVGWDDPQNYSSASDIANLSRILLNNKTFREITATEETTVFTQSGRAIDLKSTNRLLSEGFLGVKTGYTTEAGECLAALYSNNNYEVLTVVVGSPNRFYETKTLKDWINSHYLW